jgi:hypothetical protein
MGRWFLPMTGLAALTCERLRSLVRELAVDELETEYDGEHERRGVMEVKEERRQHMRYAIDALVEVLVADGSLLFRGRVLDISVAGCYIETEARLRMRQRTPVEMVFRLKNVMFRIQATSRMVRPGKGAGFLFESLNETMRAELEALIAELSLPVAR